MIGLEMIELEMIDLEMIVNQNVDIYKKNFFSSLNDVI